MPSRGRRKEPEFHWLEPKQAELLGHSKGGSRREVAPNAERPRSSPRCLRLVVHGKEDTSIHPQDTGKTWENRGLASLCTPFPDLQLEKFLSGLQGCQHEGPH